MRLCKFSSVAVTAASLCVGASTACAQLKERAPFSPRPIELSKRTVTLPYKAYQLPELFEEIARQTGVELRSPIAFAQYADFEMDAGFDKTPAHQAWIDIASGIGESISVGQSSVTFWTEYRHAQFLTTAGPACVAVDIPMSLQQGDSDDEFPGLGLSMYHDVWEMPWPTLVELTLKTGGKVQRLEFEQVEKRSDYSEWFALIESGTIGEDWVVSGSYRSTISSDYETIYIGATAGAAARFSFGSVKVLQKQPEEGRTNITMEITWDQPDPFPLIPGRDADPAAPDATPAEGPLNMAATDPFAGQYVGSVKDVAQDKEDVFTRAKEVLLKPIDEKRSTLLVLVENDATQLEITFAKSSKKTIEFTLTSRNAAGRPPDGEREDDPLR